MSTVEATGMTVVTTTSRTEPGWAAGTTTGSLLPEPVVALLSSGDVGAEIAALAVETGMAEGSLAREEREAAQVRKEWEDAQEVGAIRAEASSLRVQAWVDAGTTLGAQFGSSVIAGGSGGSGASVAPGTAGSSVLLAGKLADGYFAAGQKDDEANAKSYEAASSDAKSAADDAHDTLAGANDYIRSALAFYQEYVATRAQTLIAAAQKG